MSKKKVEFQVLFFTVGQFLEYYKFRNIRAWFNDASFER